MRTISVAVVAAAVACSDSGVPTAPNLKPSNPFLSNQVIGHESDASTKPVALIYVNGISKSRREVLGELAQIRFLIGEHGLEPIFDQYAFHNTSAEHDVGRIERCLRLATTILNPLRALRICAGLRVDDLLEARKQVANILAGFSREIEPEAEEIAETVKVELGQGRKVILLGHSQGTLMIAEALHSVSLKNCIVVVSLGAPLGRGSWATLLQPTNLYGFVVAGEETQDIILALGENDFPRLATNLTNMADRRVEAFDPNLALVLASVNFISEDLALHSMSNSYLAGAESRLELAKILKEASGKLLRPGCGVLPDFGEF